MVLPVLDESSQPGENIYIDVRAKAKPERTKAVVVEAMAAMSDLFAQHGYAANIRYEQCIEFDIICVDARLALP